ncbi:unnamed protein product, partial [Brenthis ino]
MDETVIFPSPNWFQVSGLAVSTDHWLIYGGPSKSLCILEPLNSQYGGVIEDSKRYKAHVVNRAHSEKIVSVDISKEWPEKRFILTGSIDGTVKQWSIEKLNNNVKIKSTQSHDIHQTEKEEVSGLGYSSDSFAITVGCFGNVVKWDLNSNVVNTYKQFLKSFKPNCVACSHHIPLNVAVGTRQGVVFVLDLNGKGKVIYKVRAQDDEIINLSWCPQYDVLLRKSLTEMGKKSLATERLEKIRSEPDESEETLNKSAVAKSLPDDSFEESVVEEDDMFDIYKDHEADEFGHKKYVPEDILIKVKEQKETNDFLAECLKLKEFILKKKDEESSIANLVDALNKTHVDSDNGDSESNNSPDSDETKSIIKDDGITSAHIHKHLLATIGKFGAVKLWSKSGKLVASCNVPYLMNNKGQRNKGPNSNTLLWYKPNVLLIADGRGQLLECNPLKVDCKNKIEWRIVHTLHKRGLYCIASNAPRVQISDQSEDISPDDWKIYTTAQDRNIICYSYEKRQKEAIFNTCGGFLYNIQSCPYDAKRIAISVGDGAVRVWEADTLVDNEQKLSLGNVTTFWQNVQGKVLTIAWHPTKENLLAFGTGESRIGLLDTSGKSERPAKTLPPVLRGGIYSLCWGENYDLYACAGGEVVVYRADKPEQDPWPVPVCVEGAPWLVSALCCGARALLCGGDAGALAALAHTTGKVLAATFVFNKMIHSIEWHPQQTSSSSEESPYKNLIAVSSLDKSCNIAIVEFAEREGVRLKTLKELTGHKGIVLNVAWNPHKDGILLSTSQDATVRVWDISQSTCISIFGNHSQTSMGCTWSAFPQLHSAIFSGGADCCLRVWKYEDHPPENYIEIKHEVVPRRDRKKNRDKKEENKAEEENSEVAAIKDTNLATTFDTNAKKKCYKKFLLPTLLKNMICSIQKVRKMAQKYLEEKSDGDIKQEIVSDVKKEELDSVVKEEVVSEVKDDLSSDVKGEESNDVNNKNSGEVKERDINVVEEEECFEMDFTKIFGTTNEFNEILDLEMHKHLEYNRLEPWVMLSVFRGHVAALVQEAARRDELCPFVLSLTPSVSFKYWKDVTQMYLAQIERLDAKNETEKIYENKQYGGPVYRRVALLLSLHDVKGAITALLDARLVKEAYVLARARHMDSIAQDILWKWATECNNSGYPKMAAICYLSLGDIHKAVAALAKLNEEEFLLLAAELAKVVGQTTFASHIEDKRSQIQIETPEVEELKPLPSKVDLMKEEITVNCQSED